MSNVSSVLQTGGKILHVANGDLGNANTSYTYFVNSADGKKNLTLEWVVTATTITFEFSNDIPTVVANSNKTQHYNDATAAELNAMHWLDRTTALTGSATQTTSGSLQLDTNVVYKFGRVKRVTTNSTNACDLYLHRV